MGRKWNFGGELRPALPKSRVRPHSPFQSFGLWSRVLIICVKILLPFLYKIYEYCIVGKPRSHFILKSLIEYFSEFLFQWIMKFSVGLLKTINQIFNFYPFVTKQSKETFENEQGKITWDLKTILREIKWMFRFQELFKF